MNDIVNENNIQINICKRKYNVSCDDHKLKPQLQNVVQFIENKVESFSKSSSMNFDKIMINTVLDITYNMRTNQQKMNNVKQKVDLLIKKLQSVLQK